MSRVTSFFMSSMFPDSPEPQTRARDTRLAACALLLELAYADDQFSPGERKHLQSAIRRQFGLDVTQADELVTLAEQARNRSVDLWQFTTLIKEHYSKGQKMVLLEVMWGLVYSDGELAEKEAYLMRKICNLLDLEPGYLADVRKRMSQELQEKVEEKLDKALQEKPHGDPLADPLSTPLTPLDPDSLDP